MSALRFVEGKKEKIDEFFSSFFTVLLSIGIGWSIGANYAANYLGTAAGSRVLTLRQAILLICVFGFLGAFLEGGIVAKYANS